MVEFVGPPREAVRNRPISPELRAVLEGAAEATGIDRIVIVSGGQTSSRDPRLKERPGGWIGSRRHDNGRAADIDLVRGGRTLRFTDGDGSQVAGFVTAAAARGANGIGAGEGYMGPTRIHVGFGQTPADRTKVVWGADNAAVNAPPWLRAAARAGWANPVSAAPMAGLGAMGPVRGSRMVVAARGGLWLRKGAGLHFDRAKLLEPGTEVAMLALDGEWARVDLQGDGLVDGHVYAAFLRAAEDGAADGEEEFLADEGEEEPADGDRDGAEAEAAAGAPPRRGARPPRREET